ncbi:WXG100-like domain-containing protein [Nocardia sp. NPDC004260]
MAINIPSEVALFLNICGIPYPDINEDDVRALAGHVRTFAAQVRDTHDSATGVIDEMGAFYSGESYQQLVATWAGMSATHMRRLDSACKIVGQALDVAATVITAVKVAVLAELAALAATYASMMITPPLAPSAPLIAAAARKLCEEMAQYLIGYIVAEVIGKAIEPLEQAIDDMVKGIVYDATRDALHVPSSGRPPPLHIDPDAVQHFAKVLDDHADDIMRHAATFAENVSTLDFTTSTPFDDMAEHAAPDAGAPHGLGAPERGIPFQRGEQPESRFGPHAPAANAGLDGRGNDEARVPLARREAPHAVGAAERPVERNGSEGGTGTPVQPGERSFSPAGSEPRESPSRSAAPWVAPNGADLNAADRPAGVEHPSAMSAHAGADAGPVAAHDAAPEVPARPAVDAEARRSGWASEAAEPADPVPAGDRAAVAAPVMGDAPGVPPLSRQSPGAASTPWGRPGPQPGRLDPAPPKLEHAAMATPKVRRPAVTPWTKTRRTRDVPAVVHAPSARPPLRLVREKDSEANSAGRADAAPPPARVTAPASEPPDSPPSRG